MIFRCRANEAHQDKRSLSQIKLQISLGERGSRGNYSSPSSAGATVKERLGFHTFQVIPYRAL